MKRGAIMVMLLVGACSARPDHMSAPLRVADGNFGYADGAAAKRAAMAICAGQGRRLNPNSFGHFDAGAWEFKEGCV